LQYIYIQALRAFASNGGNTVVLNGSGSGSGVQPVLPVPGASTSTSTP
jgi:hypothetical protein